jgi:hypothetical protein
MQLIHMQMPPEPEEKNFYAEFLHALESTTSRLPRSQPVPCPDAQGAAVANFSSIRRSLPTEEAAAAFRNNRRNAESS